MEQRRLRLGDILDDYCPRERRVTNHVVVAMIEDDIKQTRCTTCDAEHPYKGGKAPRRRKPDAAFSPSEPALMTPRHDAHEDEHDHDAGQPREAEAPVSEPHQAVADAPHAAEPAAAPPEGEATPPADEGPVHRPLIRATLPRPEGFQKDARPAPEFTIRQSGGRTNGSFRDLRGRGRGAGQGGNGSRPGNTRFGRGPQGRGAGRGGATPGGFGRGPQTPRHGGGKKRSR
jgi:hypothetical protein